MVDFLAMRAIPGVESVDAACYSRAFRVGHAEGVLEVRSDPEGGRLLATIRVDDAGRADAIVARLRRLFDLDTDAAAIDAHLGSDPVFAERVRDRPGLRVPGAWDGFELAVRAVLGQQISVAAATTFAGRLAAMLGPRLRVSDGGSVHRLFPTPEAMATADLTLIGLTGARARALQNLAAAVAADPGLLSNEGGLRGPLPSASDQGNSTLERTVARLCAMPGIGPWTAQYIAMRALREPDAFPASDLGLLRAMRTEAGRPTPAQLLAAAEAWRPWRAYAALRLWMQDVPAPLTSSPDLGCRSGNGAADRPGRSSPAPAIARTRSARTAIRRR